MTDKEIIALYFERSERALTETRQRYGRLIRHIIAGILTSSQDVEECENDTYLGAWQSIPPKSPDNLRAYLAVIARNNACRRYEYLTAEKRAPRVTVPLEELEEVLADESPPASDEVLREAINSFLETLNDEQREIFLLRYWQYLPVKEIMARTGCSKAKIETMLHRLRKRLGAHLQKRGLAP
ncbi:MAG: sigma-70 family RNA polymerase sigma factor [Oscillospiraceae bacterium]|nr:sigma-70 family RNA polymerase sigma factor [Oscillospiraceae bacterium]